MKRKLSDVELSMLLSGAAVGEANRTAVALRVYLVNPFDCSWYFDHERVLPVRNGHNYEVFLAHLRRQGLV